MPKKMLVIVALALALVLGTSLAPPRAEANDDLVYIIPAAIGGVAVVVVIVAILMADRSEKEFDLRDAGPPPAAAESGPRLAPDCAPTAQGRPLVCW